MFREMYPNCESVGVVRMCVSSDRLCPSSCDENVSLLSYLVDQAQVRVERGTDCMDVEKP